MEEETNSWIRRVKYSHTVCHRFDLLRLQSVPVTKQIGRESGLKSRPTSNVDYPKPDSYNSQIIRNTTINKHRSLSPNPEVTLSDTFKEARSSRKRFSTPLPRSKELENRGSGELFRQNSNQISYMKGSEKWKSRKDSVWTKYFDHGGGRVMAVEMDDELTVNLSELLIGLKFACGANSQLYLGKYKQQNVAIKVIKLPDDDENGTMATRLEKQFKREVNLLSHLHHENIIKLVTAFKLPSILFIITEYLAGGSLRTFLHNLEQKTLPLEKVISIALDISQGMEFIHSQGVVHRDLKPENIIFDEDDHVKIVDFGIACKEAHCDSLADDAGTYRWMAPEMIKRKSHGRKVDVYSFGLILWAMVAGTIPFKDMSPIQAAFAVVNKNLRPCVPADCPPPLRALIEQCWALHPEKRPEFWQIVKILEQFKSSLAQDGKLQLIQNSTCDDHKKGLLHWIQKLGHHHHTHHPNREGSQKPKPKFF